MLSAESSPIHPLFPLLSLPPHVCARRTERKRKVFLSPPSPPVRRGSSFQFASKPSLRRTTLLKAPPPLPISFLSIDSPVPNVPPKGVRCTRTGEKKERCLRHRSSRSSSTGGSFEENHFLYGESVSAHVRRHNRPMCNKSIPPPRRAPAAGIMQAVRRYRRGPLRGGGGKRKGPIRRLIDDDVEGGFASPQSPRNFLWLLRENPPEEVAKKRKGGLFGAGERQGNVR